MGCVGNIAPYPCIAFTRAIREKEARQHLAQFGDMKPEHATLLREKLTHPGDTITWNLKPGNELKKPLRQVLEEHSEGEL